MPGREIVRPPARLLAWVACAALSASAAFAQDRERASLNADWRFQKGDPAQAEGLLAYPKIRDWLVASGNALVAATSPRPLRPAGDLGAEISYAQRAFDDRGWRRLDLPHDWGIEGPFKQEYPGETGKLPWWGVGWYRKHFDVPAEDRGRRLFLEVDGAMAYASVWLNGRYVGGWPYGYASFELDLTPYVSFGAENVLAVRLDNPKDSSRWYPGGGIYRNVWLVKTAPLHVAHWGTRVTTPRVSGTEALVEVGSVLENATAGAAEARITTGVYEMSPAGAKSGLPVATSRGVVVKVAAGKQAAVSETFAVAAPKLWSTRTPRLYTAVTTVEEAGKPVDHVETVFGIRNIAFDADHGFLLNGERVPLQGVCNHHDLGALGTAVNVRALERQLELLQEMGANAIRTSHNPPAPEMLDLADKMGFLVMDEAFDAWRHGKKPNDYSLLFDDWHEKDLRALVRRDRNHPSVVLWSIGNEVREQWDPEGWKIAARLAGIVREEDRTRPVTSGFNNAQSGDNGFQTAVDVLGYNYKPTEYGRFHEAHPTIPVIGSETASTVSSRGEYFFPVSDDKALGRSGFQVSAYDLYAPRWAFPPDAEWKGLDTFAFAGGEFVWTGFDYLGEPTPYDTAASPSRSSYFGILDLAGFKKDRFFLYQARWRPELKMAHILPHWNWPDRLGQVTPVHVYSSGDEAELFLNGRSLGRKKRGPEEYRFRWDDVVYAPGELRVKTWKAGEAWAEAVTRTAGAAARLTLTPDRPALRADGSDLSFVTAAVVDKNGLVVPRSTAALRFEISGPADIVATDNGDATSLESFAAKTRPAYNGLCLVVVRAKAGVPGQVRLSVHAPGLAPAEVTLGVR